MKGKGLARRILLVSIVAIFLLSMAQLSVNAWEAKPSYPASIYIDTIWPWDDSNGVSILLTVDGWEIGTYWDGAYALADFTISEYERLEGVSWPYDKRSRDSVVFEIFMHCLYTNPTKNSIDMGFNEWWWD